ncbi:MAG: adenosylmethionine decarboxylase [Nanoarchaeota archaeon]
MIIKRLYAKLENCEKKTLVDEKLLNNLIENISFELNMTIVKRVSHVYNPGISVVFLLAESHISIHTWPEIDYADFDIVSCNKESDILKGLEIAIKVLKPKRVDKHILEYVRE